MDILQENLAYWTGRAASYSEVNQGELADGHRERWKRLLCQRITAHFPERAVSSIRVLEVGTGPGFFAILLAEAGFDVTAIDLTPSMLAEAEKNAGRLADRIRFMEMNAEDLRFADGCFDVVVSRNLTWNLPHPEQAYADWCRVLRPGGLLLNFDANWYGYLFDDAAKAAYDQDRQNTAALGYDDQNVGESFDIMEDIARRIPLSSIRRPEWDREVLNRLGMTVQTDETIWQQVWSAEEKSAFASTPMFMVEATQMNSIWTKNKELWNKCVEFHGHACGGLTIGYQAALYAIELLGLRLGNERADEQIVCIAENDACGVDAIQVILGCSIGKGNLLFHMRGKQAFSFYDRSTGRSVRLVLKPKPDGMTREQSFAYYQEHEPKDLFDAMPTTITLPEKARIFDSYACECCGEVTGANWIRIADGKKLCLDCYESYDRFDV